jgi:3-phenylpropionate/trans-cinnamate dioxygenase ferredoxin subunit
MGNLIEVLKTTDIANGQMKPVSVKEQEVLIARVSNEYYAISNICPHRGGRLSDGILNGTIVQCPVHGSQFNIANGQVIRRLGGGFAGKLLGLFKVISNIKTYKIEVEGDSIKIEV